FGEAAVGAIDEGTSDEGPYAEFNAVVAKETAGAYEGPMARFGGGPEAVAKAIERAITARRPKPRYKVTASARMILGIHAVLPDRAWDGFVGTQFDRPKPSSD